MRKDESRETRLTEREVSVLLFLLRVGLWGDAPRSLPLFPLSGESWERVFRMAVRQTVAGIVFQGVSCLPDRLLPPERLLLRWVAEADVIERNNRATDRALSELSSLFGRCGLMPVLQKGQGIARLYRHPQQRACGDIDLYFPQPQERERAVGLLREQGIRVTRSGEGSWCCVWSGIEVELHASLFDVSNPFARRYLLRLEREQGFEPFLLSQQADAGLHVPSPLLNLLLLSAHAMKHAFGMGIGLRQLCDMACACRRLRAAVEAEKLRAACEQAGIWKWSLLLYAFSAEHLGLPAGCLPCEEPLPSPRPLLDIVLKGGNFGLHRAGSDRSRQTAWGRKLQTLAAIAGNARFSCKYAPREAFWMYASLAKRLFPC